MLFAGLYLGSVSMVKHGQHFQDLGHRFFFLYDPPSWQIAHIKIPAARKATIRLYLNLCSCARRLLQHALMVFSRSLDRPGPIVIKFAFVL